jgi:cupin fold WbuC family metalloprotein
MVESINGFEKKNNSVFSAVKDVVSINASTISLLKESIKHSENGRIRICSHRNPEDGVHEMIIMIQKNSYIRPHRHHGKTESFHIIEGSADIVIFDDDGGIKEVVNMGDYKSGGMFYYRLNAPLFHTLIIKSDYLIFHETTNGPFKKGDSENAVWAPDDNDPKAAAKFIKETLHKIAKHNAPDSLV